MTVPMSARSQRRRERQRQRRAAPPPSFFARYRVAIIALVAIGGVLLVGLVFFQSATAKSYTCGTLLTPAPNQLSDPNQLGFATQEQGHQHVPVGTTINYGFCPPTSGNHYFDPPRGPIPPAVYGPAKEQPPGGWVHNLEHGYVVLAFRCPSGAFGQGDCPTTDESVAMQEWFNAAPINATCGTRKVLVVRFDSMTTQFSVLAWNRALMLDDLGATNLTYAENFASQWTNTTAPEPGNC